MLSLDTNHSCDEIVGPIFRLKGSNRSAQGDGTFWGRIFQGDALGWIVAPLWGSAATSSPIREQIQPQSRQIGEHNDE